MNPFKNAREAKEFLVSKIVDQAQHQGISLSEVERKMLYFSETDWTLSDTGEVSDEFDREYDQNRYEKKMASLIKNAYKRIRERGQEEYDAWWAAIHLLKEEDHYILVMIQRAGLRPRGDFLKLLGTGLAAVILLMGAMFAAMSIEDRNKIDLGKYVPSRDALALCLWALAASLAVGYVVLRRLLGEQKIDDSIVRLLERTFGTHKREK